MNTLRIAAAIAVILLIPTTVQAKHSHHYRYHHRLMHVDQYQTYARYGDGNIEYDSGHTVGHPAGCPGRAFCGCGVSVRVFGHPIKDLFLASNWFRFPRAAPGPGMVAVRNHHVMYIVAYNGGAATVYDPNSGGHATRVHTRSLAGYTVVNPHGSRYAGL